MVGSRGRRRFRTSWLGDGGCLRISANRSRRLGSVGVRRNRGIRGNRHLGRNRRRPRNRAPARRFRYGEVVFKSRRDRSRIVGRSRLRLRGSGSNVFGTGTGDRCTRRYSFVRGNRDDGFLFINRWLDVVIRICGTNGSVINGERK